MKTNGVLALVGSLAMVPAFVSAQTLRMPHIFSDNMLLQSGPSTPVWGWADPGATVTVSFAGQNVSAKAGKDGSWKLALKDLKESKAPGTMTVKTPKASKTFGNILVGDVWLGSGQSNMEWGVGGVLNSAEEIAKADYPLIRIFKVGMKFSGVPRDDVEGQWYVCKPDVIPWFSAVLYFFGRELHLKTGKPIGLLESCVGGTNIEKWIDPASFQTTNGLEEFAHNIQTRNQQYSQMVAEKQTLIDAWWANAKAALASGKPVPPSPVPDHPQDNATTLYNGMIYPIIPFAIKGAIWYQGESNGGEHQSYIIKTEALVEGWRKLWGRGAFPFYWVQLAGFQEPTTTPAGGEGWTPTTFAQLKALRIPNTGMASALDLFDRDNPGDIHPKNKQDVGKRLSLWALRDVYGQRNLVVSGPLFKTARFEGNKAIVSFDHVGTGLSAGQKDGLDPTKLIPGGAIKGFAIAGEDKVWHWADAKVVGSTVEVTSPDVAKPVAVRYAYRQNPATANLYNKEGLPASPFRTDEW